MIIYMDRDHNAINFAEKVYNVISKAYKVEFLKSDESLPYPLIANNLSKKVASSPDSLGILICKTGIGMSIVANKVKGIYAANCKTAEESRNFKACNKGNVLCFGATSVSLATAIEMCKVFVDTKFDCKNRNRIDLIKLLEEN